MTMLNGEGSTPLQSLLISILLMLALAGNGCSQSESEKKGVVEQTREQMSNSAVEYVNQPLKKTRQVDAMARQREQSRATHEQTEAE